MYYSHFISWTDKWHWAKSEGCFHALVATWSDLLCPADSGSLLHQLAARSQPACPSQCRIKRLKVRLEGKAGEGAKGRKEDWETGLVKQRAARRSRRSRKSNTCERMQGKIAKAHQKVSGQTSTLIARIQTGMLDGSF